MRGIRSFVHNKTIGSNFLKQRRAQSIFKAIVIQYKIHIYYLALRYLCIHNTDGIVEVITDPSVMPGYAVRFSDKFINYIVLVYDIDQDIEKKHYIIVQATIGEFLMIISRYIFPKSRRLCKTLKGLYEIITQ